MASLLACGAAVPAPSPVLGPPVDPGTYTLKLSIGGKDYTTKVVVEADSGIQ